MVRASLIFLAALVSQSAWAGRFQFKLEFSKPEIFQGESVNANFILVGDDDAVEVEVARFPEFRGYWSENIALRQGPIPLIPDFPARLFKSALVGAYRITPMALRSQTFINPMKIVVKSFMDPVENREPEYVECSIAPLKIVPLPPIPAEIPKDKFRGAVGHLSFRAESPQVFFQRDEPTQLRLVVQGDGNFQEMNEIPVTFPPEVEVLAKRSSQSGSAQMTTKTFDITIVPHTGKDFTLNDVGLVWFDPVLRGYQYRTLDPIRFAFEPKPPAETFFDHETIQWEAPSTQYAPYVAPLKRSWLWALQGLFAAVLVAIAGKEIRRRRWIIESQKPRVRWRKRLEEVRGLYSSQSFDAMLGSADELAFTWLKETAKLPPTVSRRAEALTLAQGKVPPAMTNACEKIFEAREKFAYRGIKPPPAPTQEVMACLDTLYGLVG